jgi:hypothetical protein
MAANVPTRWAFVRLWFLLFFSYFGVRLIFTLGVMGYIDLRPVALYELLLVPLGQAVVLWLVTRRGRQPTAPPRATDPSL